jgi:thiol-disulfide isomerase/thioredoxin
MRKRPIPLAIAALCWATYTLAQAPDPAQNGSQPAPKTAAQASTQALAPQQQTNADASDQPMSVADLARAARAKREGESKAVGAKAAKVVLDDDNMPRGVYAEPAPAKTVTPGSQAGETSSQDGPLAEYRGKVVLLDFWASWCGPCRNALPNVKRLQAVYGGGDFVVVSVSEDDDKSAWRTFVSSHGMTWPQRLDSDGTLQSKFGVRALPTYVLLGRDGRVVQKIVGEAPAESIVERIGPDLKATLAAK